jgi:hypothetical protein
MLAEFQSRYADVIVNDKSVVIIAKKFLDKVATVRYDNAFSDEPTMVNEDVVLVDNTRTGVYKGDTVHIDTLRKMDDVKQYNGICNGVELHLVLHAGQNQLPERFVISIPDTTSQEYAVRHDDPRKLAELLKAEKDAEPETLKSSSLEFLGDVMKSTSPNNPQQPLPSLLTSPRHQKTPVTEEQPQDQKEQPLPKQKKNDGKLFQKLSEDLQLRDFGEDSDQEPKQMLQQPSPKPRRRHSVSGMTQITEGQSFQWEWELQHMSEQAKPKLQRRHSISALDRSSRQDIQNSEQKPRSCLKSPQLRDVDADPMSPQSLSPKSVNSQRQRRHSAAGSAGQLPHIPCPLAKNKQETGPRLQRRHSAAGIDASVAMKKDFQDACKDVTESSIRSFKAVEFLDAPSPQRQRRRSIA